MVEARKEEVPRENEFSSRHIAAVIFSRRCEIFISKKDLIPYTFPVSDRHTNRSKAIWIPDSVYFDTRLTCEEKTLLVEINRLDDGFGCIVSDEHFAGFLGTSRTRVSRMISNLIAGGYVEKSEDRNGLRLLQNVEIDGEAMSEGNNLLQSGVRMTKKHPKRVECAASSGDKGEVLAYQPPDWTKTIPGFKKKWKEYVELLLKLNPNVCVEALIGILERLEDRANPYAILDGYVKRAEKQLAEVTGTDVHTLHAKRTSMLFKCTACEATFEKESDLRGHYATCPEAVPPTEDYIEMKETIRQVVVRKRRLIPGSLQPPQSNATS